MKSCIYYLIFIYIFFQGIYLEGSSLNPSEVISSIEKGNLKKLEKIFLTKKKISIVEAQKFIEDIYAILKYKYPSEQFSPKIIREQILQFALREISDPQKMKQLESLIDLITKNLVERENIDYHTFSYTSKPISYNIQKFLVSMNSEDEIEAEIPANLIIGAVETACGAILWVTPFSSVGTGLMIDGVRRMLDSVEEIDTNRRKNS